DPKIIELLKRLNSGETVQVKTLIEEHTGITQCDEVDFNTVPEGIHTLLSKLYSFRAISEKSDDRATDRLNFTEAEDTAAPKPPNVRSGQDLVSHGLRCCYESSQTDNSD